jgi:aryl-alcohol dehydrogenase-like predicted oxidoreductase
MRYRKLGRTDIEVSTVCLGCWALIGGGTWGSQDQGDSLATLRAALDAGINFFDTAPAYGDGESEALVGARSVEQVRQNAQAADVDLTADTIAALAAATEPVKARIGPNADMWQTDSRMER